MIYRSKKTEKLTQDNFKEILTSKDMSLDELSLINRDVNERQKLDKKVEGLSKEILQANSEDDELHTSHYDLAWVWRERAGGLDLERLEEDMGPQFIEKYRKDPTEYQVLNFTEHEE